MMHGIPTTSPLSILPADILSLIAGHLEDLHLLKFLSIDGIAQTLRDYNLKKPRLSIADVDDEKFKLIQRVSLITRVDFDLSLNKRLYDLSLIEGDISTLELFNIKLKDYKMPSGCTFVNLAHKLQDTSIRLTRCIIDGYQCSLLMQYNRNELSFSDVTISNKLEKFVSNAKTLTLDNVLLDIGNEIDLNSFPQLYELTICDTYASCISCTATLPVSKLHMIYSNAANVNKIIQEGYAPNVTDFEFVGNVMLLNEKLPHLTKLQSLTFEFDDEMSRFLLDHFDIANLTHNASSLTSLDIHTTSLTNVDQFDRLPNLKSLAIKYYGLEEIIMPDFSATNPLIKSLYLAGRFLRFDCSYLTGGQITELNLHTKLDNIDGIGQMRMLKQLNISNTSFEMIFLSTCDNLRDLDILNCKVSFGGRAMSFQNIKKITIMDCELFDVPNKAFQSKTLEKLIINNADTKAQSQPRQREVEANNRESMFERNIFGDMPSLMHLELFGRSSRLYLDVEEFKSLTSLELCGFNSFISWKILPLCMPKHKLEFKPFYRVWDVSAYTKSIKHLTIRRCDIDEQVNELELIAEFAKAGIELTLS